MASPRPGTSGNSSRPLAYKSPAVKTPASLHGHHVSVSSQPSSTPLAGTTVHDELLALNSPAAALMNSLGTTGLTPVGGTDGLGISGNIPGVAVRATAAPLNPELERLHRAQLVVDTLRSRVGGHGITRDGVERIAQLQGFTTLWDDDNLTIAGNCVDLEVNFEAGNRDEVRDVSLKLNNIENASESEEPQYQEQSTQVVKDNLRGSGVVDGVSQWRDVKALASNLEYLGQLDRIETGSIAFQAVDYLYLAFQKIWSAEKDRLKERREWQILRQSAVGRPVMDRKPRLGLALEYWIAELEVERTPNDDLTDSVNTREAFYSAHISCESGLPSMAVTKKWVSDRVLRDDADSMLDTDTTGLKPDWEDPAQDQESLLSKPDGLDASLEKPTDISSNILDMHFYCSLTPEIYLPLNVAANLNLETTMLNINQESTLTYQAALHKCCISNADGSETATAERWLRSLPIPSKTSSGRMRQHSYALHSIQNAPALWCYPVKNLTFTHPKQISSALPTLRQYILLWRILRSLVAYTNLDRDHASKNPIITASNREAAARPLTRSNKKTSGAKLADLASMTGALSTDEPLPIDLTLDFLSDILKTRLDLYIPLVASPVGQSAFIFLGLCVCQGGVIEVRDLRGLPSRTGDDVAFRAKIVRILEATEDIGLMVEWLLEQIGKPTPD